MFENDAWLNSHSAGLTNPEVLSSNPSSAMLFSAVILFGKLFFLISGPFCSTILAHTLELCHTYISMIGPCKSGCITSVLKQA